MNAQLSPYQIIKRVCLTFACHTLWPAFAMAEENASESRAQAFQAVSGAVKEDVPGGPLLVAAYAFVWAALFFYIWRLHKQQRELETELNDLKKRVTSAT